MPVLSSFISYRPKRKAKAARSPFAVRKFDADSSPHPYASPRILDINDGAVLAPNRKLIERDDYGSTTNISNVSHVSNISDSPQVELNLELDPEPLTDWFPTNLLHSDPFTLTLDGGSEGASGSGTQYNMGHGVNSISRLHGAEVVEGSKNVEQEDDEEDEVDTISSSENLLANLEAMDASSFVNLNGSDDHNRYPIPHSWKKTAPTPIKIPNVATHGPKVHVIRSTEVSRPTSQASSPESSAISGTTLARALIANTFILSGDTRSRYRSGMSNLTRSDSATLPRGEFAMLHSPYWHERTNSGGEMSPSSAPTPPVPPVPVNAELVYVPPKTPRHWSDNREKRHNSSGGGANEAAVNTGGQQNNAEMKASRRVSPIKEDSNSTPQMAEPIQSITLTDNAPQPSSSPRTPPGTGTSRQFSTTKRGSDVYSEGILSPGQSSISDAPSSAKDIDNVLDYYSFHDTPDPVDRNFRPAVSPITEESSSQLSPPTPFRRGSGRNHVSGRFFMDATPSPSSAGGRVDYNHSRVGSESRPPIVRDGIPKQPLLPIGERPQSTQISSGSSPSGSRHNPSSSASTLHPMALDSIDGLLLPPPVSTIFNRQRSGSAPSPIKVVRDSRDYTAYNITVTPLPDNSTNSTPTSGDSDIAEQTFPETPSAFSPLFSAGAVPSPGMPGGYSGDYMPMGVPQTPMSAFLPTGASIQPSLAQRVLLTRAATSVRHSRQASLTRTTRMTAHPYARPSSIVLDESSAQDVMATNSLEESAADCSDTIEQIPRPPGSPSTIVLQSTCDDVKQLDIGAGMPDGAEPTQRIQPEPLARAVRRGDPILPKESRLVDRLAPPPESIPINTEPSSLHGSSPHESGSNTEALSIYNGLSSEHSRRSSVIVSRPPSRAGSAVYSSESHLSTTESLDTRTKGLPRIPPSPKLPPPPPPPLEPPADPNVASSSAPSILPSPGPTEPRQLEPAQTSLSHRPSPIQTSASNVASVKVFASTDSLHLSVKAPPAPPQIQASPSYSLAPDSHALGSPPPYYTLVHSDRALNESLTPSTSGSYDPYYKFGGSNPHTPPHTGESGSSQAPPMGHSSHQRRPRVRPPLPAGPRRPSQQHGAVPLSTLAGMRARGGSVSSVVSNLPSGGSRRFQNPLPSPRFQTPPPKWRGYTMDAAKWTFTSAQLQAIVSRAIRQSSEASSIRLLRLETLDGDIPDEIERLETRRTDIKMRYKTLARRRANLLDSLVVHVDGSEQESGLALRLVEDLRDVSTSLDRLTEELHSVDQQLAQLSHLCQGHSASALAMALRKLNGSFLKQFSEAQALRQQVESLEAERDEAWKHAEDVATDYDELRSGKPDTPSGSLENRFSRVLAVRKSSIRASKAGLRSGSRRLSQRSSVSSNHNYRALGMNTPSSARTTLYTEDIPPVPPIPRRRPMDIMTDIPMRSSVGISTSGPTPTSETRAMVRAQEELYDMLGITINDNRSRRSRSVIGLPGEGDAPPQSSALSYPDVPNTGRRASLPGSPVPQDKYGALTAGVSIILKADREGWI